MAENKMGPNIQAGAGIFAKRVQKSLSRAQEKVLQKLGKTMETKDELFEQCSQNLNKQQTDGGRLYKDVKAYYNAVKVMHESSRRLSQTLKDIYESDWLGGEDLSVIMESEDLLWNDYEEKLADQIVRTMENYTSQFPEVKERVAKRGRKLVDYDSARHHLEALQSAKKKDDAKIAKADEEFNKAQNVFDEINKELREELPALYQSRIGCYVTVFQNVSNLRDVFYKEMSVLNHELYNVMKKLETQHSGKAFIVKGLSSTKSKTRKSLVISNPIPCNTAFPADHVSLHCSGQNGQDPGASTAPPRTPSISEEPSPPEEGSAPDFPPANSFTSDSDDLSSDAGDDTSKRQSACESESGDGSTGSRNPEEEEAEQGNSQSDDSGVEVPRPDCANQGMDREAQREARPARPADPAPQEAMAERTADPAPQEAKAKRTADPAPQEAMAERTADPAPQEAKAKAKPPPIPAPRASFHSSEKQSSPPKETDLVDQKVEAALHDADTKDSERGCESQSPPGFLYKAVALESHTASEEGLLQFEEGDVILVLAESQEEGVLKGIREESWNQHHDVDQHSGIFPEKLIQHMEAEGATQL